MKLYAFILALTFFGDTLLADTHHKHPKNHKPHKEKPSLESIKKVSPENILVKVHGMVCSFCAQGVEKNFKKRKEVKAVKVNLDKMEVHLSLNRGASLSKNQIKKTVEGAGFKFMDMKHE